MIPYLHDSDHHGNKVINAALQGAKFLDSQPGQLLLIGSDRTLIGTAPTKVKATDFGAIGNLVFTESTYETVAVISGSDSTLAIQNALNYAGSLVSNEVDKQYEGNVVCFIDFGNYLITNTIIVPPNVVLHCEGTLFNFLLDPYAPIVRGSRHSHCRKLKVHANAKSGVTWGDAASGSSPCASRIEELEIWHAGVAYNKINPPNGQKCGLRLHGLDFRLGNIWIKGGNIGLHLSVASDVLAPNIFLIGCATGMVLESCEQIELPSVRFDTNIDTAIAIDNTNNCYINGRAFVNSDSYGTPMKAGVVIGKYSGNPNRHIHINYEAQSTGGYGLDIAQAQDVKINLILTNSRNYAQTSGGGTATSHYASSPTGALLAHDIGTLYAPNGTITAASAIKYGNGLSGYLDIDLSAHSSINPFSGTRYGNLRISGTSDLTLADRVKLDSVVDLTSNQDIEGSKNFLDNTFFGGDVFAYGFQYAAVPANKQFTREMSGVLNDFIELGNFYTQGGGQVIRVSVVGVTPGISLAQTYELTTIYDAGDSGWRRLIPEKSKLFLFFQDVCIDVRTNIHTTYLRLRKTLSDTDPFTARIRVEFLGNYESTFTETSATGNDATVVLTYFDHKPPHSWITPNLNSGWSNFGAPHAIAAYRKAYNHTVEIKGLVKKSSPVVSGEIIFNLPPGYRTTEYRVFSTLSSDALARVDLQSNGDIVLYAGNQGWVSLDGITYTAEH